MAGKSNHNSTQHKSSKDNKKKMSSSSSTYVEQGSAGVNPRRAADQNQSRSERAKYARDYPPVQYKDDRQKNRAQVMGNVKDLGDPRYARSYDPNLDIQDEEVP
ncbi:hypothetical protein CcaCcLH18_10848 [Colletotrichum camelliae]|nr:hypothetical protein CcaCcLH18_10848 [Colletotrichum camelliae]